MALQPWHQKIANPTQLGGIETAILDNGSGKGTRIAWINTGTGLRYKVVLDRAMDIADAFFNQHSLAWISHAGVTSPEPFSNHGLEWLRTFGGGLVTTCGLSHFGGPENSPAGELGLHGQISNIPAEIESIIQPDIFTGQLQMQLTGRMKQTQVLGPSLELKRTITSTLGEAKIQIQDTVINRGNQTAPHMLLYHCNFGWPLVDEGTDLIWSGNWESPGEVTESKIFQEGKNFKKCLAPLEAHAGTGEEVAFIQIEADKAGVCTAGLHNAQLGIALALRFPKSQLPWLTNWQHWGKNEYVTGLEPGTNPPIGQGKAREQNTLIYLEPGESRQYYLEIEVLSTPESIAPFIQNYQVN
ncbi:aldose 1-epimerase family protein [Adhaeribacter swui]|uniref:Aldose 1-epimerase family protein n=1 Tax=Adhaeribacter swui TaxID=2086471 RepID=A0A7G7GBG7_9BACT|nr:aldose 1-epimerase family protein [Adhaeribacter swui]QNF34501.1 aldose 1-epimerase family protein [Adhaeribacter swui]